MPLLCLDIAFVTKLKITLEVEQLVGVRVRRRWMYREVRCTNNAVVAVLIFQVPFSE